MSVGPQTALNNVTLQVFASDPVGIKSATLKLDGVTKTPYVAFAGYWEDDGCSSWFVEDRTQGTVGYRPPSLSVGSHDVVVTVTNNSNQTFTKQWSVVVEPAQTTFTAMSPASGAVANAWDIPVSLQVNDPVGLNDGPVLTIDGVPHTVAVLFGYDSGWMSYDDWNDWAYNYYPGPGPLDYSRQLVSFTPGLLADGIHEASLVVTNSTGRTGTTSWTFSVAAPPRIGSFAPASNGVAAGRTPLISARVTDNGTVSRVVMLVDGVEVASSYDPVTGLVAYTPATPLANDRTHTVSVSATDAGGLTTSVEWSFKVQVYADMPTPGTCTDCHDATQHPMQDCGACHGPIPIGHGLAGDVSWCLTCHRTSGHGPEKIIPGVTWGGGDEPQEGYTGYWGNYCDYCHSPKYPTVPRHETDNAAAHATSTDMASCDECHVRELTREHFRRADAVGAPLDCWTCHGDLAPEAVKAAIAAGDTSCAACHGSADHESLHVVDRTDSCARCHAGSSLTNIHPLGSCDYCHASTDAVVVAAVDAGDKACTSCHGTAGHESLHYIAPRVDTCVSCHAGESLTAIHATCEMCHDSTKPAVVLAIDSGNKACGACHVTQGLDYHLGMSAAHVAPVAYYETCGHCHHAWGSNPLQGPNITRHKGGCALCHNATLELSGKTAACDSCHGTAPGAYTHALEQTYHVPQDTASLACADCHKTTDVRTLHATNGCSTCHVTLSCTECHKLHNANAAPLLVGTSCANCHKTAGVDYHASYATSHTYGEMQSSCQAAGCHSNQLVTAHSAFVGPGSRYPQYADTCALCHKNADQTRIPVSATAACDSCHAAGDHEALHVVDRTDTCVSCHAGTSLTTIHTALGCAVCHTTTDTEVAAAVEAGAKSCSACHAADPHPNNDAVHTGTMTTATFRVFDYHEGYSPLTWDLNCGMCHTTFNMLKIHANDCSACHNGAAPADSFVTWNKGCSQGSCHPSLDHPLGQGNHDSYDCEAACHEPSWAVYESSCAWCHTKSASAAPVTTTNLKSTYTGSAAIGLFASGVSRTYYRLDGGPIVQSDACNVAGPLTGSVNHTLEYWSVSDSGVVEVHRTSSFTISADSSAPLTTSNALSSYVGPASITLTVTDNDPNHTPTTYWRLDGGPVQTGRFVNVPQPVSGTVSHTLEFWSVDYSGNAEAHKFKSFTCTADTLAPTTSGPGSLVYAKGSYYYLNLTRTDPAPSSGISATYYRINNGGVSSNVSGSSTFSIYLSTGVRVVRYWSVDRAGNTEVAKTTTVVVDPTAPYTTSNGLASYTTSATIRLTATDTYSGVVNTYYSLDGGATTSATVVTVETLGAHTLRFWSVDRAGNVEVAKTLNFTVYSPSADRTAPTTTSDVKSTYTVPAVITLTAADNIGGDGIQATYYRLDSGTVTPGTVIHVPMPDQGSVTHRIEYWSVDKAGNTETHRFATFTMSVPVTTGGVLRLIWGENDTNGYIPQWDSWASWTVRSGGATGPVVASGSAQAGSGWDGIDDVIVPVSSTPYYVHIDWWDADWEYEGPTIHPAVYMTSVGQVVILRY